MTAVANHAAAAEFIRLGLRNDDLVAQSAQQVAIEDSLTCVALLRAPHRAASPRWPAQAHGHVAALVLRGRAHEAPGAG